MATKSKKTKQNSRVNKKVSKKQTNRTTTLWVALGIVALIAVVGITVRFFSNAGTTTNFNPVNATSRQALAAFAYRASGSPGAPSNTVCGQGKSGPFSDVPGNHTFCKEIEWAKNNNILVGYSDGTFKPTNIVDRSTLALVTYRMAGSPDYTPSVDAKSAFTDLNSITPNLNSIYWAWDNGITKGYEDGTYRPQAAASRQAVATFLWRLKNLPTYPEEQIYADVLPNNQFYAPIQWMGSLSVKPNFNPVNNLSRQAMAVFAYRASGSPALPENTTCGEGRPGPFADVPGNYAFCKEIEWAKLNKILTAADINNNVEPTMYATRSNLALMLYTLAGYPNFNLWPNDTLYSDVPRPAQTREANEALYIYWARANGFLTGYENNTFRPTNPSSRQAAAEGLYRLKGKPSYPTDQIYADVTNSNVFFPAIQWMGSLRAMPVAKPDISGLMFYDSDTSASNTRGMKGQ